MHNDPNQLKGDFTTSFSAGSRGESTLDLQVQQRQDQGVIMQADPLFPYTHAQPLGITTRSGRVLGAPWPSQQCGMEPRLFGECASGHGYVGNMAGGSETVIWQHGGQAATREAPQDTAALSRPYDCLDHHMQHSSFGFAQNWGHDQGRHEEMTESPPATQPPCSSEDRDCDMDRDGRCSSNMDSTNSSHADAGKNGLEQVHHAHVSRHHPHYHVQQDYLNGMRASTGAGVRHGEGSTAPDRMHEDEQSQHFVLGGLACALPEAPPPGVTLTPRSYQRHRASRVQELREDEEARGRMEEWVMMRQGTASPCFLRPNSSPRLSPQLVHHDAAAAAGTVPSTHVAPPRACFTLT